MYLGFFVNGIDVELMSQRKVCSFKMSAISVLVTHWRNFFIFSVFLYNSAVNLIGSLCLESHVSKMVFCIGATLDLLKT